MKRATERLEHLRGPGAKWSVLVGDRVADLSNEVSYRFRSGMRGISRAMDEMVEALKTPEEWDNMVRLMQSQVADEVTRVFVAIEEGRASIRAEVATLLQDEHLGLPRPGGRPDEIVTSASCGRARRSTRAAARRPHSRRASPDSAVRKAAS
jgi:hypothetical protein